MPFGEDWSSLMESPKWYQAGGRLQQIVLGDHRMNINDRTACVGWRALLPSSPSSRESLVTTCGFHWWWDNFQSSQHCSICLSSEQHGLMHYKHYKMWLKGGMRKYLPNRNDWHNDERKKNQSDFKAQINSRAEYHMWSLIISLDKAWSPYPLRAQGKSAVLREVNGLKTKKRRFCLLDTWTTIETRGQIYKGGNKTPLGTRWENFEVLYQQFKTLWSMPSKLCLCLKAY